MLLLAQPYSHFVAAYDGMVGVEFFQRLRRAFEALVPHYGIRFCSAADIGCGTGLFACYLNRCWGVPVFAVDKSAAMLCEARRRCGSRSVCFLQQDVRNLCLPEAVDLVTANFDTLNHLVRSADLQCAFQRVAANLRPGGHFYFDLVTPCHPLGGLQSYRQAHCTKRHWMEQRVRWEPARRLMRILIVHRQVGCAGPVIERHTERAYGPSTVGRGLLDAGLVIRGVHDEATLQPVRGCPARMIVIAQKPQATRSP
jgi:SAM-dependent methyltransferase